MVGVWARSPQAVSETIPRVIAKVLMMNTSHVGRCGGPAVSNEIYNDGYTFHHEA
jgi:hypothetical protein